MTEEFQFISPNGRIHEGYDHIMKEIKELFGDKYFIDGEFEYYDEIGTMTLCWQRRSKWRKRSWKGASCFKKPCLNSNPMKE